MTMSLYGRRPSVVRSLVSCTSLMTTPSMETIIFGMADSSGFLLDLIWDRSDY